MADLIGELYDERDLDELREACAREDEAREKLANLAERLRRHDWYYMYSDDHSVWRRGNDMSKENDELLKALVTSGDLPVEDIIEALAPVLPSDIDAEGYVRRFLG